MNPKLNEPWIPLSRVESMIELEPALMLVGLALAAWLVYRVFLRGVTPERHRNLRRSFLNLLAHLAVFSALLSGYAIAERTLLSGSPSGRVASYLGLATLIAGAIVFVKVARILLNEYLFLGHMKEGVPILIGNLFSLLLSVAIAGWFATEIFGIKLAPVLATSAVFSLILGLALQDTIGNLFAGVALQLDKPYEIGDWIEVVLGGQTWTGQVEEITWRATTLVGLFDELLVLPNKTMSTAEISNFSARGAPIWRSQSFRIPYTADLSETKKILEEALAAVDGVRKVPSPVVWIRETTESWLVFRTSYTIDEYPAQWRVGSAVISAVVEALKRSGQAAAAQRVELVSEPGGLRSLPSRSME